MEKEFNKKETLSIPEAAKLLGISRIAVYKKVRAGKIKAQKVGRQFVIAASDILKSKADVAGRPLDDQGKARIRDAVKKVVQEYGEVLDLLGKE